MSRDWIGLALAATVSLSVLLQGCAPSAEDTRPSDPAVFNIASTNEVMIGWDPGTHASNEVKAMPLMYEGLTRYDPATDTVRPLLAESFEVTPDGLQWTFRLRAGVTFHTGRKLTAGAVKEAFDRNIDLGLGSAYIWSAVETIVAPDPLTVVFHLRYPAPIDLIAAAAYQGEIYDVRAAPAEALGEWFAEGNDAGTGPYTVDAWHRGQEVELRLKAYGAYWGGWEPHHYRNVVFRVVREPNTAAQLLNAGELSFVEKLTPQLWASFEGRRGFQTTSIASFQNMLMLLNTKRGALSDHRVRQAISYGIDYEGLVAASHGALTRAHGLIPHGMPGESHGLQLYEYDPGRAVRLLQQAGYGPGGETLRLDLGFLPEEPEEVLAAMVVKANLAALNIVVEPRPMLWELLWATAKTPDPSKAIDMMLMLWWPDYPAPPTWFAPLFGTEDPPHYNVTRFSDRELDPLMSEAQRLLGVDRAAATEVYRRLQVRLLEAAPAVLLGDMAYQRVLTTSTSGYVDNPVYPNAVLVRDLRRETTPGIP
ncbi:MAG TPA: ABC transporter substrate-binding protein [Acidobacteriota bacterium]|nr:ABC transporter substrate-binding protein [Acidobacteriota bacterium]